MHDQHLVFGQAAAAKAIVREAELLAMERERLQRHVVQPLRLEQGVVRVDDDQILLERRRPQARRLAAVPGLRRGERLRDLAGQVEGKRDDARDRAEIAIADRNRLHRRAGDLNRVHLRAVVPRVASAAAGR